MGLCPRLRQFRPIAWSAPCHAAASPIAGRTRYLWCDLRYLRRSRSISRGPERQERAESAPAGVAPGRTGVRTLPAIYCEREIDFNAPSGRLCRASRPVLPESRPLTPPSSRPCAGRRTPVRPSRRSVDRRPGTSGAPSTPRSSSAVRWRVRARRDLRAARRH